MDINNNLPELDKMTLKDLYVFRQINKAFISVGYGDMVQRMHYDDLILIEINSRLGTLR